MNNVENRLGHAVEEYGSVYGLAKKNAKHAATGEIEFPDGVDALRAVRDVLTEVGDILKEDLEDRCYVAVVMAGTGNANPALVVALIEKSKCSLGACAKEGLIKQSTAKKALEKIKKAVLRYSEK